MALPTGIEVYNWLTANEPLLDPHYAKEVAEQEVAATVLICKKIHDALAAYRNEASHEILQDLEKLCGRKGANYSEFIAYWPAENMNQSIYAKDLTSEERLDWVGVVVPRFLARRWANGVPAFSSNSVLAQMDAKAHKRGGAQGPDKVRKILSSLDYVECHTATKFQENDYAFLLPDSAQSEYLERLETYAEHFAWGNRYSNKIPDGVVRARDQFFIIEHKHKKEGGGGQNGAVIEVLDLIETNDASPNVHYVGFLDGIWWNRLFQEDRVKGGSKNQHNSSRIHEALTGAGANNFFVNTEGLRLLFAAAKLA